MTQQNIPKQSDIQPATLQQVLAYFDSVEPGKLPQELFPVLVKLQTLATVELVPIRTNAQTGSIEVLLTQRPMNGSDPWAGEWHTPGTVLLASDTITGPTDFSQAFERLLGPDGELKSGVQMVEEPVFVAAERRMTRRGPEFSAIYVVRVEGDPTVGQFFDIAKFPQNVPERGVVEHHIDFIPRAVEQYRALQKM